MYILYIIGKSVFNIVDKTTCFQASPWLKNIIAKHVWEQLQSCWINLYFGLPDFISANKGKLFIAYKFKQYTANIKIMVQNISVEAYHSIRQIERYHRLFHHIYFIITTKTPGVDLEIVFQMAFKAIHDSVLSNALVFMLFFFDAYACIIEINAPSPTITQ